MKNLKAPLVLGIFIFMNITPSQGWVQTLASKPDPAAITAIGLMSQPGSPVPLSTGFNLAHFKGMVIDPLDPFKFDFIIHQGDENLSDDQKQQEYTKLIKYFLAALAVPDTDQWVNLSPYEKNRIIAGNFGKTDMGRDLLAQDYLLKQLASSLTNPETMLGRKFWDRIYGRVYQEFGRKNIPLSSFSKVWIVPDKAVLYEKGNMVYVIESHLKVMTQADYLAMKMHRQTGSISNEVMRQIIIPAIEQEVNEGKNFAPLRQVFSGMLLATWYKRTLKDSILTKLYANKSKLKGVDQDPRGNEKIYQEYLKAYKKGVYNMIKEETDPVTQEVIPRKYFSGGTLGYLNFARIVEKGSEVQFDSDWNQQSSNLAMVTAKFKKFLGPAAGVLLSLLSFHAHADSVNVGWTASPDTNTAGYDLYIGTAHGVYTNVIKVGNVNQYTVSGLQEGMSYYFALKSRDLVGIESTNYSNEIAYDVPVSAPVLKNMTRTYSNSTFISSFQIVFNNPPPDGSILTVQMSPDPYFKEPITVGHITAAHSITNYFFSLPSSVNNPQQFFRVEVTPPAINVTVNPPPAAVLEGMSRKLQSDGLVHSSFQVDFGNDAPAIGSVLTVQESTDLKNWTNKLDIITTGESKYFVTIPDALNSPQKFYRTVLSAPSTIGTNNPTSPDKAQVTRGGIDFAESNLDMQIKRDGQGIVLPMSQQNLDNIHIDGLIPVILDIKQVKDLPAHSL